MSGGLCPTPHIFRGSTPLIDTVLVDVFEDIMFESQEPLTDVACARYFYRPDALPILSPNHQRQSAEKSPVTILEVGKGD